MSILAWVVLGLIAGVIANFLDPRPSRGGLIGAMLLGVVGALVGGFLSSVLLGIGISGFNLSSITIAVLGSLLLLLIGRTFVRETY